MIPIAVPRAERRPTESSAYRRGEGADDSAPRLEAP
jgi:hypothetical protein